MDLYIRSQDRKKLFKYDSLSIYCDCEEMPSLANYEICDSFEGHVAVYKSEKRALEVLDEIQKILMPPMLINSSEGFITGKDDSMHIINPSYNKIEQPSSYVYEMPKE